MTIMTRLGLGASIFAPGLLAPAFAFANEPQPWQIGLQPAVSPTMEKIHEFNNLLLPIISFIVVFVLGLLLYVMWRFNEKHNPNPSKTTHNTLIEIVWTVVPVIMLVIIAIPSFQLLYFSDRLPEDDVELTVKAIGRQWYWSYEYPDNGNFTFDAYMIADEDIQPGQRRLLDTDYPVVLPVDTNIRILVTAGDVLHNWAMPSMGIKMDGVPGRINETWTRIPAEFAGQTMYGQCSELCGTGHAFMPIMVKAVSKEDYAAWVKQAQEEFARVEDPNSSVELAETAGANAPKTD